MFIAMNRFKITPGKEKEFETIWRERDSHLDDVSGFKQFHLLRGAAAQDHTLYSSHTVWDSKQSFEAWTHSDAFKAAHRNAGDNQGMYLTRPEFESFEAVDLS